MEEPAARLRRAQINARHQVARNQPSKRVRVASHTDVHGFLRRIHHLEVPGKILKLERNPQAALHRRALRRNHHPEEDGERERHDLQTEVRKRLVSHQSRLTMRLFSRSFNCVASNGPSRRPSSAIEMLPVSSDTTMAIESFSSVRPMAARWRVPRCRARSGLTVSGRKQAAAATRSFWTMTAPSCSGDFVWKMLTSRSYVSSASSGRPPSM